MPDNCQSIGCHSEAFFNAPDKNAGLYCSQHKKDGMLNVRKWRCQHPGCVKIPLFDYSGNPRKRGSYCDLHKMSSNCQNIGCLSGASFNDPDKNTGLYCHLHKKDGMIYVRTGRCQHPGCVKFPLFDYPGNHRKRGAYCDLHKKDGMILCLRYKKCNQDDCQVVASFNTPDKTEGLYCKQHKKNGMLHVRKRRCQHSTDCIKHPSFDYPGNRFGKRGSYCSRHKKDGMIDVTGRQCKDSSCTEYPYFNHPGTSRGIYCDLHKKEGMIYKGKRNRNKHKGKGKEIE